MLVDGSLNVQYFIEHNLNVNCEKSNFDNSIRDEVSLNCLLISFMVY